jgi:hypothetical protein
LIAGLAEDRVASCLDALRSAGVAACVIGRVTSRAEGQEAILDVRGSLPNPEPDDRPRRLT